MKLLKTRRNGGKYVNVPPELEPFVQFLFDAGYKEPTVATIVVSLKAAQKNLKEGKDLKCKTRYTRRNYRYALRKYKEWLARELSEHKNKLMREFLKEVKEE